MSEEKLPLMYDVVYPSNLVEEIKHKGKCDAKELAKTGMVLIFDSVLPKEECNEETFSTIPKMFVHDGTKVITIDLDKYFQEVNDAAKFIQTTGVVGNFPLWLFENTFYIAELFSKKKMEEIDEQEKKFPQISAQFIQIENEEAKKVGKEHWVILVSTHKHLVKGFYLDNLLEVHRRKWNNILNGKTKNKKRNGRTPFTKSIRHEVFKRDNYKCVECGATKEKRCLHIDHIIPVSRGGTDELDNLQTLCEGCNLAKKNRIINGNSKKRGVP